MEEVVVTAMRNVYLSQVNYAYGNNVYLPYSVGMLQAYCQTIPDIRKNFAFKELLYLREDVDEVLDRVDEPAIFGLSCYIWNWEYQKKC